MRLRFQQWAVRLHLLRDERGANLVEYVLLLMLIAIFVILAVSGLGSVISHKYSAASSAIP